jgi:hypothetical protein
MLQMTFLSQSLQLVPSSMPQCTGQKKAVKARNNEGTVHEGAALHRMNSKRVMLRNILLSFPEAYIHQSL